MMNIGETYSLIQRFRLITLWLLAFGLCVRMMKFTLNSPQWWEGRVHNCVQYREQTPPFSSFFIVPSTSPHETRDLISSVHPTCVRPELHGGFFIHSGSQPTIPKTDAAKRWTNLTRALEIGRFEHLLSISSKSLHVTLFLQKKFVTTSSDRHNSLEKTMPQVSVQHVCNSKNLHLISDFSSQTDCNPRHTFNVSLIAAITSSSLSQFKIGTHLEYQPSNRAANYLS